MVRNSIIRAYQFPCKICKLEKKKICRWGYLHSGNILIYSIAAHLIDCALSLVSAGADHKDWLYTKNDSNEISVSPATIILRTFGVLLEVNSLVITYFLFKGLRTKCVTMLLIYMIFQPMCIIASKALRYIIIFGFADWKGYLKEKKYYPSLYLYVFLPVYYIFTMYEWIVVRRIRLDMISKSKYSEPRDDVFIEKHLIYPCADIIYDKIDILDEGLSSKVFKGRLKECVPVAIKKLKDSNEEYNKILFSEIKAMNYVGKHNHIVEFIGLCQNGNEKEGFSLILELCPNGNLEKFLRKYKHLFIHQNKSNTEKSKYYTNITEPDCSITELNRLSHEIALGMEYLSSRKIIHGDLAARNILLDSNLTAKISDFGLSLHLYRYMTYLQCPEVEGKPLPWRWMSIEALEDLKFSEKSDVWAFGVTLWEIYSLGEIPFVDVIWTASLVDDLKTGILKLEHPSYGTVEICQVMDSCINHCEKKRPNFSTLALKLQDYSPWNSNDYK